MVFHSDKKVAVAATKNLNLFLKTLIDDKVKSIYSYLNFLRNKLLVANAVKLGVSINLFNEIVQNSPFSELQWANFLEINIRTLQRYKQDQNFAFKKLPSEKIFEIAEVVCIGKQTFDSAENFELWLNMPSIALSNLKPIELLDSSYGIDLVMAELNRIEHGIFI